MILCNCQRIKGDRSGGHQTSILRFAVHVDWLYAGIKQ